MRSRVAAVAVLLAACGESSLPPFGQLRTPGGVAAHASTGRVFVASEAADELRVLDASRTDPTFLTAPNPLFPLSIPTVRWPTALSAGEETVFVLSSSTAQLGFVDARAARGIDVEGNPVTLSLGMVPSAVAALDGAFADPGSGIADRGLVVGVDGQLEGRLDVVLPAFFSGDTLVRPQRVTSVPLPGAFPTDVQVEPRITPPGATLLGGGRAPVADCRLVAVADGRFDASDPSAHVPGVLLLQVRIDPDGSLSVVRGPELLPVEVEVERADGSTTRRNAPVRAVAFAPVPPVTEELLAAVTDDPCAVRPGRIMAVLDPVYCEETAPCPDLAFLDLPEGHIARDAGGGEAVYDVPGAALGGVIALGPYTLRDPAGAAVGFSPAGEAVTDALAIAVVTSTTSTAYFVSTGLGPALVGPGDTRRPSDTVFRVDAVAAGPSATDPTRRGSGTTVQPPDVDATGAQPRNESWTASYRARLPGFGQVGTVADVLDGTLEAPAGLENFLTPVPVVAEGAGAPADVLLPRPSGGETCPGFAVVAVAPDGSALTVRIDPPAAEEPPACRDAATPLELVPSAETPWLLAGSTTGFAGRLRDDVASDVFSGTRRLFRFLPSRVVAGSPVQIPPGSSWTFETSSGFSFLGVRPEGEAGAVLLPSGTALLPRAAPGDPGPGFGVFVTYSGTSSLLAIDPGRPTSASVGVFE